MATRQQTFGAVQTITISPHSTPLASSSTFTVGRESTAIDNTTNRYLDCWLTAKVTTGTSPTGGYINVYLYGNIDDTPNYPDVLDGTDSDETFTSENVRGSAVVLIASMPVDTTSNRTYHMAGRWIAKYFGGRMPKHWGVFVSHSTGVALNSTAANHVFQYIGYKEDIS